MGRRWLLVAVAVALAVSAVGWSRWGRRAASDVPLPDDAHPRIAPRLVEPGTRVICGGLPEGYVPRWSLDGEPLETARGLTAPDTVGGVLACRAGDRVDRVPILAVARPTNVLLVILDDIGVDRMPRYGVSDIGPRMPTLEALADEGVLFREAYTNPSCSPTRAGMMTGLYSMNVGIGGPLRPDQHGLPGSAWTLPEALDELAEGYAHAAIGKWHLTTSLRGPDGPNAAGFQHYAGNIDNFAAKRDEGYDDWTKVVDGQTSHTTAYATTDNIDDTLAFLKRTGDRPWFVWLALNAGHVPMHTPPRDLFTAPLQKVRGDADRFDLVMEAADTELGRLLDALPTKVRNQTTIIVLGDNGTPTSAVRPPTDRDHAKFSLYEGGVHVPLIVAGPHVRDGGREEDAFVSHVDLFPTIIELAGGVLGPKKAAQIDGRSLLVQLGARDAPAHRHSVYAEDFKPNGLDADARTSWDRMVRIGDWKLISRRGKPDELYHIERYGIDGPNLMSLAGREQGSAASRALSELRAELEHTYAPRPQ